MKQATRLQRWVAGIGVVLGLLITTAQAQPRPGPGPGRAERGFELRPGVLIDPERGVVYSSHPEGAIEALDLATGQVLWHNHEAAKPLLLYGEWLIAQAEPTPTDDALRIVVLHAESRDTLFSSRLELPDGAQPAIDDRLGRAFVARARVIQGRVVVSWSDTWRPVSALPQPEAESTAREVGAAAYLDLEAGRLLPIARDELPTQAVPSPDLPAEQRLAGLPGAQFRAADGQHVMVSRRVEDDRVDAKYQWHVHAYPTGQLKGQAPNRASYAPFGVVGSWLLHESRPTIRRQGDDLIHEPLELRVIDLVHGREIWRWAIRDTTYRGPFPP